MGNWHKLEASDGTIVPVCMYEPVEEPRAIFLMLPALGVKAKFYKHVAKGLVKSGIAVALFEQRGHGESPYRPKRGAKVGYDEYLEVDLPLVMGWLKKQYQEKPLYIGGHSLGAHHSNYLAARQPGDIAGLIHMACVFPYYGFYPKKSAMQLRMLCSIIPFLTGLLGYYPGQWLGFGSKEYRQVMLDWRKWALTGCYDYGDVSGIEEEMAEYKGPLLSVSFENDALASDVALKKPHATMAGATVTRVHLTQAEQGKYVGHFDWA